MRILVALSLSLILATAAHVHASEGPRFSVQRFEIEGDLPIPRDRALALLAPFTGNALDLSQLQAAAAALEAELFARGYAFYRVVVPPQALDGYAIVRVLPFKLAKVTITGNNHFSSENVLASLPDLKEGTSPNVFDVARERAAANEHAAKRVEVTFRQSEIPDSVEADVAVEDRPALSTFVGLSNTGDQRTGKWRALAGFQYTNLWNLDHSLTATYTTSPDHTGSVKQYGLYYRAPFYRLSGALTFFYAHSDVNSGTVAQAFQVSGRGSFYGLNWRQHLTPVGPYSHSVEVGIEDRVFNNDVQFGGQQLGTDLRSRPASATYRGRYDAASWAVAGGVQYAQNVAGGSANNNAAYFANRAGAGRAWEAWRYDADGAWRVAPITFTAKLRGQYSAEPLVPGEQFGMGGAQSVRGFKEREATGDYGYTIALEALMPLPWDGWSGVVFFDNGVVRRRGTIPGEPGRQTAASVGIGLRWTVARRLSLAVDAAQVLDSTILTAPDMRRVHVTLVAQF